MKEINKFLAEGLECKELIIQKNKELRKSDSATSVLQKINVNLNKDISAAEKKELKYKTEIAKMDTVLIKSDAAKQIAEKKTESQINKKKVWRGIALGEAGLIAITILILLL